MEEEDLGNASWLDAHEEHHHTESLMPRKNKGKGKAREIVGQEEEDEESSGSGSTGLNPVVEEEANGALEYPPTNGEDEESKRVAEVRLHSLTSHINVAQILICVSKQNLRRW